MEYAPILVLVISFIMLLAIGTPVAWSIAISSVLTMLVSIPVMPAFTTVAQRIGTGLDSFALLAIPLFILSGELMNKGGIANRLIAFAKTLVGALPGGLALINIISAMLMGAIAGSAMAAASAMGSILGPEMEKEGTEYFRPVWAEIAGNPPGKHPYECSAYSFKRNNFNCGDKGKFRG